MQNTLLLIRQKVGHGNVREWINKEFGMDYRTFIYQVREETMRYKDIKKLLSLLDIKFEDLRSDEYTPQVMKVDPPAAGANDPLPKPEKLSSAFGL